MKIQIRSKNPSAVPLRRANMQARIRTTLRLGSTTPTNVIFPVGTRNGANILEINTVDAVKNSSSKILMKRCFDEGGVIHAPWMIVSTIGDWQVKAREENFRPYPAIIKHKNSSQGNGIYKINDDRDFNVFLEDHENNLNYYIIEKYYTYVREYRLHVCAIGCIYACRKMLRNDVPVDQRFHRHDNNSVWILEENPQFDRPNNWDHIVEEATKAMKAVGLDIAAVDIKTTTKDNAGNVEVVILETNSAPALGDIGVQKYIENIPALAETLIRERFA